MKSKKEVVLSEEALEGWKRELVEIDAELEKLNNRRTILNRRIQTYHVYFEDGEVSDIHATPRTGQIFTIPKTATMREAIRAVLTGANTPVSKLQIRDHLVQAVGKEKLGTRYGYFYNTLKKMVESGELKEIENEYVIPGELADAEQTFKLFSK